MNFISKTAIAIGLVVVAELLLLFGGGSITGVAMSSGMSGDESMRGISWMWIPTVLMIGLGALLVWVFFDEKR